MRTRRKRARLALMATVAVLAAGMGVVAYEQDLLRWLELQSIDARFGVRGTQAQPKGVAVVAIDAQTFSERPDDRWPFLRRRHAKAIEILHATVMTGSRDLIVVAVTDAVDRALDAAPQLDAHVVAARSCRRATPASLRNTLSACATT